MGQQNFACPNTGQLISCTHLVPNKALKSLISLWCTAQGERVSPAYDADIYKKLFSVVSSPRVAIEANKATAKLLIERLSRGADIGKIVATRGLQFLASLGEENAVYIAEAGAISLLKELLSSPNPTAQENCLSVMLTLSTYVSNKIIIVRETGCLELIIKVLRWGHTEEAREKAASILLSFCSVYGYRTRIGSKEGAIPGLLCLLKEGTPKGKQITITTLHFLSFHVDHCRRMVEAGAVKVLAMALDNEGVAESAAGVLRFLIKLPIGSMAVRNEMMAISGLFALRNCGNRWARANADAALKDLLHWCVYYNSEYWRG